MRIPKFVRLVGLILITVLYCRRQAFPQSLAGQIGASIYDPSGAVIPSAQVDLLNLGTQQMRSTVSDREGRFVFSVVSPGTYALSIRASGYKEYKQEGLVLSATQRLALRPITLDIGSVTQEMTVQTGGAIVETQSGERSGTISDTQLTQLPTIGRNFTSLLALVPGVIQTSRPDAPNTDTLSATVNGSRGQSLSLLVDGVPSMDTGAQGGPPNVPSIDSIQEVKVLTSNYQAEYGRSYGGAIMVTTKAGTGDFHGGAYYFVRNEAFNANNYFNNLRGVRRGRYRYNLPGYYLGGPVDIPKVYPHRDKIFFFFSQEFLPTSTPNTYLGTVPTALERKGDFSQSLDSGGHLIPVYYPGTRVQFPGNIIPSRYWNSAGQALLNVFPLPNYTDPTHQYNIVEAASQDSFYRFDKLRVDFNINTKNQVYVIANNSQNSSSGYGNWAGDSGWPHLYSVYNYPQHGFVGTFLHTFNSTTVNEATIGVNHSKQYLSMSSATIAANDRTALGVTIPQFYPQNNPYNVLPNTNFGNVQHAWNIGFEGRFPFDGSQSEWVYTDNLSKVVHGHNIKIGINVDHAARRATAYGSSNSYNGNIDFSPDSNNPYDTNYAYANTLVGSMARYSETNKRQFADDRFTQVQWFLQDNWRVTRKLTLDVGFRFGIFGPTFQGNHQPLSGFDPSLFNAAAAPSLISPILNASGQRVGYNPATGQQVNAVLIGSLAPGSGTFWEGMRTYPQGSTMTSDGVHTMPRVGFAYDLFGDGKTAIRGGFGIFPGRVADDRNGDFLCLPPVQQNVNIPYTTISQLHTAAGFTSPQSVLGIQPVFVPPTTYNWSLGVQRDIGFRTVFGVAYVGSVARHLMGQNNLNAVNYGAQKNFKDPTDHAGKTYLPLDFARPLGGYQDVLYETFGQNSNYHSMQTTIQRSSSHGLSYGLTWTWSKSMNQIDGDQNVVNPFINPRIRNYGKSGSDRTHNVAIDYVYHLPAVKNKRILNSIIGNWETTGILTFLSGTPQKISFGEVNVSNIIYGGGAGVDSRVDVIGNPNLGKGQRTFSRAFNTAAIAMPNPATDPYGIGNAKKDVFRGPGIENADLALFKNIAWGGESRTMQFRVEAYNAFNHTQFNGVNTSALFDPKTGEQTNTAFGSYTSAQNPRRLQLGFKISF